MSFKEIKELRQAGKLDEALQMAHQALEAEPDNIWNKRAAAWVYYDYLKKNAQPESFEAFKENLIKIKDLQLPEDEKMVFDNCAWPIGKLVFALQRNESVDYVIINALFEIIRDFHFTKPSEAYSFIYKAFHKGYHNWSSYLTFADWWNFENLRSEDYLKEEFNGKKMMSIAEQAYIAYSKKLLEGEPLDPFGQQRVIDKENIQSFLPKLDSMIDNHPDYQYPPYFKAKLLLAIGDVDNALESFLPFAKQKQNDFWAWSFMAEIFKDDKELEFACYCKALSLRAPSEFLIKTRETFTTLLIDLELFSEAKVEIKNIINVRENKEWKMPLKISQWTESEWYQSAKELSNNEALYEKHKVKAEKLLYSDMPEHLVAVEFVNHEKKIINFIQDKLVNGFFNYDGLINNVKIGDVLNVRMEALGTEGYHRVFTLDKINDVSEVEIPSLKEVSGSIRIPENKNFGFLDDVFVPPNLIDSSGLVNAQEVSVRAILSFNKSKNEWGWKGLEVLS